MRNERVKVREIIRYQNRFHRNRVVDENEVPLTKRTKKKKKREKVGFRVLRMRNGFCDGMRNEDR